MTKFIRSICLILILVLAIPLTALAESGISTEKVSKVVESEVTATIAIGDMSGLAVTTNWYSASWFNGWTRRNRLRTTRGATTTNHPLWSSHNYHINRTTSAFNVSFTRSMTRSGTVSLGAGVTSGAIRANMGAAVGFSNTVTVGASSIRVPANRRVTMQTRTSVQTTTFNTTIQEQRQGLFQAGQWTNHGSARGPFRSTFSERVPGFRAFETAVNTPAPR